jgi:ACS family glucarate transporter-like MFS transporter
VSDMPLRAAAPARVETYSRWLCISLPLLLAWTVSNADKANLSVLLSNNGFMRDLGLVGHPAIAGLLGTVFFWTYGLSQPLWGLVTDRLGPRWTSVIGSIVWSLAMFWGGAAGSATALIWSRILLGIGEGYIYVVSFSMTARWFPLKERARAQGLWFIGANVGPAIGLPLVTYVTLSSGWRTSFYVLGVLSLITALVMAWVTRDEPQEHPACSPAERAYIQAAVDEQDERTESNPADVLANRRFWLLTVAYTFQAMSYWAVVIWFPSYLEHVKHLSYLHSALITTVGFVLAVAFQLGFGYASDRRLRRAPFAIAGWIAVMVLMAVDALSSDGAVVSVMSILIVALLSMTALMVLSMLHNIPSSRIMGRSAGVFAGVANFMSGFGPLVVGFFAAFGGFSAGLAVVIAALIIPIACVGSVARQGY